jgi:hypothetical protein
VVQIGCQSVVLADAVPTDRQTLCEGPNDEVGDAHDRQGMSVEINEKNPAGSSNRGAC